MKNRLSFRAEFCFVFGHRFVDDIAVMKVVRHFRQLPLPFLKFFQRKVEQARVVRFKIDTAALRQQTGVAVEKIAVRQAALGVALLRPGVAEIDKKAGYLAGREDFFQTGHVEPQQVDVVHLGGGAFLAGVIQDADLDFNADEICFRMELGHLGNEIPLARAELYPQGLVRIFEQLPPFSFMFFTMFQVDERSVIQNGLVNPRFSP